MSKVPSCNATTGGLAASLCILVVYVGISTFSQSDALAEDKSTSITCTGVGSCEKTECVNGNCETTATNSSNISSSQGTAENKESNKDKSVADSLKERLSLRGE
jgi:hypothetical protein